MSERAHRQMSDETASPRDSAERIDAATIHLSRDQQVSGRINTAQV